VMDGCLEWTAQMTLVYALVVVVVSPGCVAWLSEVGLGQVSRKGFVWGLS